MSKQHDILPAVLRVVLKHAPDALWFDEHPEAVEFWEQWLVEHKERQLRQGETLGPVITRCSDLMPAPWPYLDERSVEH